MRFRSRTADRLTFELSGQECQLLIFLLKRYPVLDVSYHQISQPEHRAEFAAAQEMLAEHMTEAQSANRRQVAEFIRTRLAPPESTEAPDASEESTTSAASGKPGAAPTRRPRKRMLTLTPGETDWLLQIINDIRIGSWVRLGRPESNDMAGIPTSTKSDYFAMELCGYLQMVLLAALGRG